MDISLSTVIELNVLSTHFLNFFLQLAEDRSAFVKINPNIVAIFGAIIPEPLAIPLIKI